MFVVPKSTTCSGCRSDPKIHDSDPSRARNRLGPPPGSFVNDPRTIVELRRRSMDKAVG
jgi:hypothetical protein